MQLFLKVRNIALSKHSPRKCFKKLKEEVEKKTLNNLKDGMYNAIPLVRMILMYVGVLPAMHIYVPQRPEKDIR